MYLNDRCLQLHGGCGFPCACQSRAYLGCGWAIYGLYAEIMKEIIDRGEVTQPQPSAQAPHVRVARGVGPARRGIRSSSLSGLHAVFRWEEC